MKTIQECVDAGTELLEMKFPGRLANVDDKRLKMWDPELCILALVFGSYEAGLKALGISEEAGENFGFNAYSEEHKDYVALNQAWATAIFKQRTWRSHPVSSFIALFAPPFAIGA